MNPFGTMCDNGRCGALLGGVILFRLEREWKTEPSAREELTRQLLFSFLGPNYKWNKPIVHRFFFLPMVYAAVL